MAIRYYQDYWTYTSPSGEVLTQAQFQEYLDKHHPRQYPGDYSTQGHAERKLLQHDGWKKVPNEPNVPPLEAVVGKYLLVSQHMEPRTYIWEKGSNSRGHWEVWNYKDLDTQWWRLARPDVVDEVTISWGRSCWQIGNDGTLTFAGADYDSSD